MLRYVNFLADLPHTGDLSSLQATFHPAGWGTDQPIDAYELQLKYYSANRFQVSSPMRHAVITSPTGKQVLTPSCLQIPRTSGIPTTMTAIPSKLLILSSWQESSVL